MWEIKNAAGDGPADLSALPEAIRAQLKTIGDGINTLREKTDEIEKKSGTIGARVDALDKEQIVRINATIEEMKTSIAKEITDLKRRKRNADGTEEVKELAEYKTAFDTYLRKGGRAAEADLEAKAQAAYEAKAMSTVSDPDGGFLVLPQVETQIDQTIRDITPMRQVASVVTIGTNAYRKPMNVHGTASGWVGETNTRTETASSELRLQDFPVSEIYAMPSATQNMLDDALFNVESFIADEAALEFAVQEGAAFVNGNAPTRPRGFLTYTTAADAGAGVAFGSIGRINTGVSGDFKARSGDVNPADDLVTLQYRLKPPFRANAVYMMNKLTLGRVRILKDGQGNFIGGHRLTDNGIVDVIYGRPVVEAEDMPNIGAGSLSIAFGDFRRGYLIVDRAGIRTLRDPFTNKPYVMFYTTKRVGGGVQNYEAIKLLQFS